MTAQRSAIPPPADLALTSSQRRAVRARLLAWYQTHAQPFPWRHARDPYSALVGGVAAQQTQIARVLEVHARWMTAFPTLADLAAADRAAVLRVWGRAGYPRRAVALHETARRCVAEHGGALPHDPAALLALPGVGPFTAAIVRTFGFGEDVPAIDTNVVRVLGRLCFGAIQPAAETPPAAIEAAARVLLPRGDAARWNPALMDFGAAVCLPRPRCGSCPVARWCAARPAFEAGAAAIPLRRQAAFAGSDRQRRGAILAALREAGAPLTVRRVEARLGATTPEERARVRMLLAALERDGLLWTDAGWCHLGEPPADRPRDDGRGM